MAVALSKLGQKDIETRLIANLKDESYSNFHSQIIKALGLLKSKKSIPLLISKLKDKNIERQLRQDIVGTLSVIGGKLATDTIITILKEDSYFFLRSAALKGLSDLMGKQSIPILIPILKGKTESIRSEAAKALGNLKAKEAIPALNLLLEDDRFYVRYSAKKALKEINKE
ncbi:MAG: HEAT repeat domain-containing protein [Blastocatellia bacterium]|nr:HEAT repeat domain-containing protein [Blastocatellia bacterium]